MQERDRNSSNLSRPDRTIISQESNGYFWGIQIKTKGKGATLQELTNMIGKNREEKCSYTLAKVRTTKDIYRFALNLETLSWNMRADTAEPATPSLPVKNATIVVGKPLSYSTASSSQE